jgi:ketosteroid isomerase-like protein
MLRYGIRLSVSVATFFLGLALSAALSLLPSTAPRGGVLEQEVLNANQEYLQAHMNRDVEALDRLLADEFTVGGRSGRAVSKPMRLAMLSDPNVSFLSIDSDDTQVAVSGTAGEVSGRAVLRGSYKGRPYLSPPYRYIRRFEKRDGRWQVVSVEIFRGGWE